MAGSSDAAENPVAINVTPMVDVIFCLCLFFMCSFKFKQAEAKMDTWLPKDKSGPAALSAPPVLEEIRIFMRSDGLGGSLTRRAGRTAAAADDDALMRSVLALKSDYERLGKTEVPVLIDASADVPWEDVVHVIDLCKGRRLDKIELVGPIEPLR